MFGTIIMDKFRKDDVKEIAGALDELCSPNDNYGWASAGIYSFWNYHTKEVLYIGLAIDLTERFKQHTGLIKMDPKGCKVKQIEKYFQQYNQLGYAIFVQSPLSQPVTSKNKETIGPKSKAFDIMDATTDRVKEDIRRVEGIMLETYRIKNGDLPPWNKVHGSTVGQKKATEGNYEIIKSFTLDTSSLIASRYTLRELAENPTFERYENFMHAIRMLMFMGMDFATASKMIRSSDILNTYDELSRIDYMNKRINI
jgi:hypothetical protein